MFSHVDQLSCGNPITKNLHFSFEGNFNQIHVVGSINGLVCLDLYTNATLIVLWNPAIRKYFQIPNPRLLLQSIDEKLALGFTFDQETDSYKVVRILSIYEPPGLGIDLVASRVEIYSTETNNWRRISAEFPSHMLLKNGVAVFGVPYWFTPKLIVWFDASSEAFRSHPLPLDARCWSFARVGVMGDNLGLMRCEYGLLGTSGTCINRVEIWKLRKSESGAKDSFHIDKLMTVELGPIFRDVVGFWENGEIIVEDQNFAIHLYDKEECKHLASYEASLGIREVYYYTESLVWPFRLA